ncbi:hypothetical protein Pse7367_2664 [Thalassoporum mexicanum PCC 7367]|uniref:hypothetical protein n=1 Tax=Thalassoporum mexicanum TaxID=3457544 RepID=UPI00029FB727|nr:hypothetical protein [Pseudanabaena sp. PCC 7367]AFY70919.1 hypothetical protein Pse7367_2664 [Pseudanabaena sp. PCC 7367]
MKPKFSTLIILTFITALLLLPFAISGNYLPTLREQSFNLYQVFQGEIYKQVTGYVSLAFVLFEMVLTVRKRGRGWLMKITIPGSIIFWRSLHIFIGVGLVAATLIHTIGANGLNFNAIFLWVFFAVTLSALVGVVAETGVLESSRRYYGTPPAKNPEKEGKKRGFGISKGKLIAKMRDFWLPTHIILVAIFFVMLGFHIFIAYYYQ